MPEVQNSLPYRKLKDICIKTNSTLLVSRRGVPYLVSADKKCSVAYFGRTDSYKIWEDFDKEEERSVGTYPDMNFVVDYLNDFHCPARKTR